MRIKKSPCGAGCGVIFLRYGVGMAAGERAGAQPPPPPCGGAAGSVPAARFRRRSRRAAPPIPHPAQIPPKENRPGQRLPGANCYAEINR